MNIITIDCGASFIKGCLFKDDKATITVKTPVPASPASPLSGTCYIEAVTTIVREMIIFLGKNEKRAVLTISNQMHGFLLCSDSGIPITDYISWQRPLGRCELKYAESLKEAIIRTGMDIRANLPSSNLLHLLRGGFQAGKAMCFYTLGDYLLRALSGIQPNVHASNAAATGLYDLINGDWSQSLLSYLGADQVRFCPIGEGAIDFALGDLELHAFPAIGDQQAALLGAGLSQGSTLAFNLGTGGQVARLSRSIKFDPLWQVRPYFHGEYLLTIPHIPCGRSLNVYVRFIRSVLTAYGFEPEDDALWQGVVDAPGRGKETGMDMDLGFFENAINDRTTGEIYSISEFSLTMDNLFFALFNRISSNFVSVADRLWKNPDEVETILFSGGIAERFPVIREAISKHYPGAQVVHSSGDTLDGLAAYAIDCLK